MFPSVSFDQRWGYDSIGNRTREHDLTTNVTAEYSHNNTNQLLTRWPHERNERLAKPANTCQHETHAQTHTLSRYLRCRRLLR